MRRVMIRLGAAGVLSLAMVGALAAAEPATRPAATRQVAEDAVVPREKYNALKLERDRLTEKLAGAEAEVTQLRAEVQMLRQQLQALAAQKDDQPARSR